MCNVFQDTTVFLRKVRGLMKKKKVIKWKQKRKGGKDVSNLLVCLDQYIVVL